MTASFGRLQNHTLELTDGLNILQAPNESGKSTWCAFLLAMLYGINSRERDKAGFIADKNRYAPWSGVSMSGRLDCQSVLGALTLSRSTRRQTAPLGEFSAVFTGTGDQVPELTGQNCGEHLLGVSREVYERSAFIRQAGLPISQDAGLERRIAALITSGEEDTSYSEAADTLKRQLNRRRHNKTGQLPALEAELQETRRQLAELEQLECQLSETRAQVEDLAARETELTGELSRLDRWESAQKRQALRTAETDAARAEEQLEALRQQARESRLPENDTIGRLRGAIVNLETVRRSVEKARAERDEAMKAQLRAEAAVHESPFAGQTAEEVRRKVAEPPKAANWNIWPGLLTMIVGTAAAFAALYAVAVLTKSQLPAAIVCALLLIVSAGGACQLRKHSIRKARNAALVKRFGTDDQSEIAALADTYYKLYEAREAAQADLNAKSATADALYASLSSNEQGILLEVRRFAPAAFDISTADQLLRSCAVRRRELAEAETAAREARMRRDLLAQQSPAEPEGESLTPPPRSREVVTGELDMVRASLAAARSAADRLTGQLHAVGDPVVLQSAAGQLEDQLARLEGEYNSIRLAMETLDSANTALQSRFSPALGKRAAEIFRELTGGHYTGVVLDRSLHLSAEPQGDVLYRDAALLSSGAADQLYLSTRLAICDLVLPSENAAPIVLDDALANFDDERCAAALRWLKEAARSRQILLFTCHSREASFFEGDSDVSVRRLAAEA